ncbi:hypothetical protein WJX79_007579 [Trebouxia sp. C0005]
MILQSTTLLLIPAAQGLEIGTVETSSLLRLRQPDYSCPLDIKYDWAGIVGLRNLLSEGRVLGSCRGHRHSTCHLLLQETGIVQPLCDGSIHLSAVRHAAKNRVSLVVVAQTNSPGKSELKTSAMSRVGDSAWS